MTRDGGLVLAAGRRLLAAAAAVAAGLLRHGFPPFRPGGVRSTRLINPSCGLSHTARQKRRVRTPNSLQSAAIEPGQRPSRTPIHPPGGEPRYKWPESPSDSVSRAG